MCHSFCQFGNWKERRSVEELSHSACPEGMSIEFCFVLFLLLIDVGGPSLWQVLPAWAGGSELYKNAG